MKAWTVAEVLAANPGTPVEAVTGQVVTITPFRYGENEYGGWTLQNIWITDGTGKIKVKLGDQQKLEDSAQGATITIVAGAGKRQGTTVGLKVDTDNYKGQVNKMLSANRSASVTFAAKGANAPIPAQPKPPAQTAAPAPAQGNANAPGAAQTPAPEHHEEQAPEQPPAHQPAGQLTNADRKAKWAKFDGAVNKLRRMRLRTLMVAHRIAEDAKRMGINVDAQHIEKIDSWVAIECCRNGLVIDVPDCDPPAPVTQQAQTPPAQTHDSDGRPYDY